MPRAVQHGIFTQTFTFNENRAIGIIFRHGGKRYGEKQRYIVRKVTRDSQAEEVGIIPGLILLTIDGTPVKTNTHPIVGEAMEGRPLNMTFKMSSRPRSESKRKGVKEHKAAPPLMADTGDPVERQPLLEQDPTTPHPAPPDALALARRNVEVSKIVASSEESKEAGTMMVTELTKLRQTSPERVFLNAIVRMLDRKKRKFQDRLNNETLYRMIEGSETLDAFVTNMKQTQGEGCVIMEKDTTAIYRFNSRNEGEQEYVIKINKESPTKSKAMIQEFKIGQIIQKKIFMSDNYFIPVEFIALVGKTEPLYTKNCPILILKGGGKSLKTLIIEGGLDDYTTEQVCKLCIDIATGIQLLHDLSPKIVHGDLKSDNILIQDDNSAKIIDFGESYVCDPDKFGLFKTKSNEDPCKKGDEKEMEKLEEDRRERAVTFGWSAPELFHPAEYQEGAFNDYNEKIDIYSLGMVILELVSRKLPWGNLEDPEDKLASAIESKNRKISDLRGIAIEGLGDETQATRAGFNLVGEEGILRAANYLLREAASGAQAESGVQTESAAREEGRAERDVSTAQADRVTAKIAEYVKKVEIMNREIQAVNSHRETNQSIKFPEGELATRLVESGFGWTEEVVAKLIRLIERCLFEDYKERSNCEEIIQELNDVMEILISDSRPEQGAEAEEATPFKIDLGKKFICSHQGRMQYLLGREIINEQNLLMIYDDSKDTPKLKLESPRVESLLTNLPAHIRKNAKYKRGSDIYAYLMLASYIKFQNCAILHLKFEKEDETGNRLTIRLAYEGSLDENEERKVSSKKWYWTTGESTLEGKHKFGELVFSIQGGVEITGDIYIMRHGQGLHNLALAEGEKWKMQGKRVGTKTAPLTVAAAGAPAAVGLGALKGAAFGSTLGPIGTVAGAGAGAGAALGGWARWRASEDPLTDALLTIEGIKQAEAAAVGWAGTELEGFKFFCSDLRRTRLTLGYFLNTALKEQLTTTRNFSLPKITTLPYIHEFNYKSLKAFEKDNGVIFESSTLAIIGMTLPFLALKVSFYNSYVGTGIALGIGAAAAAKGAVAAGLIGSLGIVATGGIVVAGLAVGAIARWRAAKGEEKYDRSKSIDDSIRDEIQTLVFEEFNRYIKKSKAVGDAEMEDTVLREEKRRGKVEDIFFMIRTYWSLYFMCFPKLPTQKRLEEVGIWKLPEKHKYYYKRLLIEFEKIGEEYKKFKYMHEKRTLRDGWRDEFRRKVRPYINKVTQIFETHPEPETESKQGGGGQLANVFLRPTHHIGVWAELENRSLLRDNFKCKSEERAGLRSGGISELDGFDTIVKSIPFDTAFYCAIQNVFEDSKLRKYNFTFLGILMEYNIFKNALERNKGKTDEVTKEMATDKVHLQAKSIEINGVSVVPKSGKITDFGRDQERANSADQAIVTGIDKFGVGIDGKINELGGWPLLRDRIAKINPSLIRGLDERFGSAGVTWDKVFEYLWDPRSPFRGLELDELKQRAEDEDVGPKAEQARGAAFTRAARNRVNAVAEQKEAIINVIVQENGLEDYLERVPEEKPGFITGRTESYAPLNVTKIINVVVPDFRCILHENVYQILNKYSSFYFKFKEDFQTDQGVADMVHRYNEKLSAATPMSDFNKPRNPPIWQILYGIKHGQPYQDKELLKMRKYLAVQEKEFFTLGEINWGNLLKDAKTLSESNNGSFFPIEKEYFKTKLNNLKSLYDNRKNKNDNTYLAELLKFILDYMLLLESKCSTFKEWRGWEINKQTQSAHRLLKLKQTYKDAIILARENRVKSLALPVFLVEDCRRVSFMQRSQKKICESNRKVYLEWGVKAVLEELKEGNNGLLEEVYFYVDEDIFEDLKKQITKEMGNLRIGEQLRVGEVVPIMGGGSRLRTRKKSRKTKRKTKRKKNRTKRTKRTKRKQNKTKRKQKITKRKTTTKKKTKRKRYSKKTKRNP